MILKPPNMMYNTKIQNIYTLYIYINQNFLKLFEFEMFLLIINFFERGKGLEDKNACSQTLFH